MKLLECSVRVRALKSLAAHSTRESKIHLHTQKIEMCLFRVHRMHLCMCVRVCYMCACRYTSMLYIHADGDQRSLLSVFANNFSILLFGAGSLTDLAR